MDLVINPAQSLFVHGVSERDFDVGLPPLGMVEYILCHVVPVPDTEALRIRWFAARKDDAEQSAQSVWHLADDGLLHGLVPVIFILQQAPLVTGFHVGLAQPAVNRLQVLERRRPHHNVQKHAQAETHWVGRVESVDAAEGVGGKDAGMARLRSAPKPSLELVGGPGVVLCHVTVPQGPCKLVSLAQRKELSQFGVMSLGNSLPRSLLCEVYSRSVLKKNVKMHDGQGPLMHWQLEQSPDYLIRAYVPAVQVVLDHVQTIVVALQGEHGLVAPLFDILV